VADLPWTIAERLAEVYRRLHDLPAARSADEAFQMICDTLEHVEDEFSGIPRRHPPPEPPATDGRMYPPTGTNVVRLASGAILARSRRHSIEVSYQGSIVIRKRSDDTVDFAKSGAAQ